MELDVVNFVVYDINLSNLLSYLTYLQQRSDRFRLRLLRFKTRESVK